MVLSPFTEARLRLGDVVVFSCPDASLPYGCRHRQPESPYQFIVSYLSCLIASVTTISLKTFLQREAKGSCDVVISVFSNHSFCFGFRFDG